MQSLTIGEQTYFFSTTGYELSDALQKCLVGDSTIYVNDGVNDLSVFDKARKEGRKEVNVCGYSLNLNAVRPESEANVRESEPEVKPKKSK